MTASKRVAAGKKRRKFRVRNRLRRSAYGRPRLSVFRSNKHIYAQIIDDIQGHTLVAASSREGDGLGGDIAAATQIGTLIAERALEKGITQVVFDRGTYQYHGRVKALADAAREKGLDF